MLKSEDGLPTPRFTGAADPMEMAGRRFELHFQEASLVANQEQQRRAREHMAVLAKEKADQAESVRADHARLAALDALARAGEGAVPDAELEAERRKLRVRLEERPTTLTAALQADLQRLEEEAKELTERIERNKRGIAEGEAIRKRYEEDRLQELLYKARHGTAAPAEIQYLTKIGRWPQ
jgi:hypothetical protein